MLPRQEILAGARMTKAGKDGSDLFLKGSHGQVGIHVGNGSAIGGNLAPPGSTLATHDDPPRNDALGRTE